jgi:diguanylate cyclase (GGDEF)-like protein
VRLFTGRLNQEQLLSGLLAAVTGGMLLAPAIVTDVMMRNHPMQLIYVFIGFAVAGVPGTYITAKLVTAREGSVSVQPNIVFLTTCCSSLALLFGQLGTHGWSGNAYVAALVLPCVFFAVVGDTSMIAAGLGLTCVELAIGLSVDHLGASVFAATFILFASVDIIAALMVAPAIRRLHFRYRSREAVSEVTGVLSTAATVEEGFNRCIPLIHTVIPCTRVVVVARSITSEGYHVETVSEWQQEGSEPAGMPSVGIPNHLGGPTLIDGRCFVPVGYSTSGELIMVISGLERRILAPFFVIEAATGLAASMLMMTSRISYVAVLKHESRTDPLTSLANRRGLEERLEIELAKADRTGSLLSVAMLDLDHFKAFNDRLGHQQGDKLLEKVSKAMDRRLRTGDLLARYGGEEFCLVLPDTSLDTALTLLNELRAVARDIEIEGGAPTVSVGVAQWNRNESLYGLVQRADEALYRAKEQGRDRVVYA